MSNNFYYPPANNSSPNSNQTANHNKPQPPSTLSQWSRVEEREFENRDRYMEIKDLADEQQNFINFSQGPVQPNQNELLDDELPPPGLRRLVTGQKTSYMGDGLATPPEFDRNVPGRGLPFRMVTGKDGPNQQQPQQQQQQIVRDDYKSQDSRFSNQNYALFSPPQPNSGKMEFRNYQSTAQSDQEIFQPSDAKNRSEKFQAFPPPPPNQENKDSVFQNFPERQDHFPPPPPTYNQQQQKYPVKDEVKNYFAETEDFFAANGLESEPPRLQSFFGNRDDNSKIGGEVSSKMGSRDELFGISNSDFTKETFVDQGSVLSLEVEVNSEVNSTVENSEVFSNREYDGENETTVGEGDVRMDVEGGPRSADLDCNPFSKFSNAGDCEAFDPGRVRMEVEGASVFPSDQVRKTYKEDEKENLRESLSSMDRIDLQDRPTPATRKNPPQTDLRMQNLPPQADRRMQNLPPHADPRMQNFPSQADPRMQNFPPQADPKMHNLSPQADPRLQNVPSAVDPRMQYQKHQTDSRIQHHPLHLDPRMQYQQHQVDARKQNQPQADQWKQNQPHVDPWKQNQTHSDQWNQNQFDQRITHQVDPRKRMVVEGAFAEPKKMVMGQNETGFEDFASNDGKSNSTPEAAVRVERHGQEAAQDSYVADSYKEKRAPQRDKRRRDRNVEGASDATVYNSSRNKYATVPPKKKGHGRSRYEDDSDELNDTAISRRSSSSYDSEVDEFMDSRRMEDSGIRRRRMSPRRNRKGREDYHRYGRKGKASSRRGGNSYMQSLDESYEDDRSGSWEDDDYYSHRSNRSYRNNSFNKYGKEEKYRQNSYDYFKEETNRNYNRRQNQYSKMEPQYLENWSRPSSRSGSEYRRIPVRRMEYERPSYYELNRDYLSLHGVQWDHLLNAEFLTQLPKIDAKKNRIVQQYLSSWCRECPEEYTRWYEWFHQAVPKTVEGRGSSHSLANLDDKSMSASDGLVDGKDDGKMKIATRPAVKAKFTSTGQLIVICPVMPNVPKGKMACIDVLRLSRNREIANFPGPFISGETHKNIVSNFLKGKCEGSDDCNHTSERLLYSLVDCIIDKCGITNGISISELLMSKDDLLKQLWVEYVQDDIIGTFWKYLLIGDKRSALDWCKKKKLWGHAFTLSLFANYAPEYINEYVEGTLAEFEASFDAEMQDRIVCETLQTLYKFMSMKIPDICYGKGFIRDWQPHLAIILSNPAQDADFNKEVVVKLGDTLARVNDKFAAYFCYISAELPYDDNLHRFNLLSSYEGIHCPSHTMLLVEAYEYAKKMQDKEFRIIALMPYKYTLAVRFLQYGEYGKALGYVESIASDVLRHPTDYSTNDVSNLAYLAERIKRNEYSLDQHWLISLRRLMKNPPNLSETTSRKGSTIGSRESVPSTPQEEAAPISQIPLHPASQKDTSTKTNAVIPSVPGYNIWNPNNATWKAPDEEEERRLEGNQNDTAAPSSSNLQPIQQPLPIATAEAVQSAKPIISTQVQNSEIQRQNFHDYPQQPQSFSEITEMKPQGSPENQSQQRNFHPGQSQQQNLHQNQPQQQNFPRGQPQQPNFPQGQQLQQQNFQQLQNIHQSQKQSLPRQQQRNTFQPDGTFVPSTAMGGDTATLMMTGENRGLGNIGGEVGGDVHSKTWNEEVSSDHWSQPSTQPISISTRSSYSYFSGDDHKNQPNRGKVKCSGKGVSFSLVNSPVDNVHGESLERSSKKCRRRLIIGSGGGDKGEGDSDKWFSSLENFDVLDDDKEERSPLLPNPPPVVYNGTYPIDEPFDVRNRKERDSCSKGSKKDGNESENREEDKRQGQNEDKKVDGNGDATGEGLMNKLGKMFGKLSMKQSNQMILPDDRNPSIVYNPDKKCWEDKNSDGTSNQVAQAAPPKMNRIPQQGSAAALRPQNFPGMDGQGQQMPPSGGSGGYKLKGRGMKSNYVNILSPSSSGPSSVPFLGNIPQQNSIFTPGNSSQQDSGSSGFNSII